MPHQPRQPRWQVIAEGVRDDIRNGTYPVGSKLPTREELAQRYHTAPATVQHAIDELSVQGYIDSRPGLGWYARLPILIVLKRSSDHWLERNARVVSNGQAGEHWHPDIRIDARIERADRRVAEDLKVRPGVEVCVRERQVVNYGEVIHLGRTYLPREITRGTPIERPDIHDKGTYEWLRKSGHSPHHFTETVTVGLATKAESKVLGLDLRRRPLVVRIVRIVHGQRRRLEVDYLTVRMGHLQLVYELTARS